MNRRAGEVLWRRVPATLRQALVLLLLSGMGLVPLSDPPTRSQESAEDVRRSAPTTALVVSQVLGLRLSAATSPGAVASETALSDHAADRDRTALWDWPLVGTPPVERTFDPPAKRWLPGHRGIDLVGIAGEQVLAVEAGVVSFSGEVAGVGVVSVTHESGLRSTYQPVEDRVARGDRVRRGQSLGVLGATASHCVLGACLHLGAMRGRDDYVDPLPLLLGAQLSLLPVGP